MIRMLKPASPNGLQFLHAWRQSQGRRARQEDFCMTSPPSRSGDATAGGNRVLVALADGMGGHTSGQIASRTVCDDYVRAFAEAAADPDVGQRMVVALERCNDAVASAIATDPSLAGMGSTLVAAHVDGEGVRWVSVGDSTLMLYREGILQRLNADHSHGAILDQQAAAGIISEEVARSDTRRRALHSALTGHPIPLQDLGLEGLPLEPGDWVILASDGLLTLTGDEIATMIHDYASGTPDRLVAALVDAVEQRGEPNQDNTTVAALNVVVANGSMSGAEGGAMSVTDKSTRILPETDDTETVEQAVSAAPGGDEAGGPTLWIAGLGVAILAAVAVWLLV